MTTLPDPLQAKLVFRSHDTGQCVSRVWYSTCGAYRYGLSREWDGAKPALLFIMLNPSTADEMRNDPTVARCESRARKMGFGGLMVANIFAFRATLPSDLKKAKAPIGPENDAVLAAWAQSAGQVIAAWGAHGGHQGRGLAVASGCAGDLFHLGLTKDGHPRHPLYVRMDRTPELWAIGKRYI